MRDYLRLGQCWKSHQNCGNSEIEECVKVSHMEFE